MDTIQIFNRAKKNWSIVYPIMSGFQENWVLDRTTDFAKDIKIISYGKEQPVLEIFDWVILKHSHEAYDKLTYKSYYSIPDNHSQYIISDFCCEYNSLREYWIVTLSLVEPIERFRGVLGETLTFTNQTRKVVDGTALTRPPYNHLTALERWLKLTPANCDVGAGAKDRSWYNRIKLPPDERTFLENFPFSDTTINELSLYELLMDVYDSSTGRTPVAYCDINTASNEPFNLNRDEYVLFFEKQDGSDKEVLSLSALTEGCASITYSKSCANYATGVISNVENLSPNTTIVYPADTFFAAPEIDSDERILTNYNVKYNREHICPWVIKLPFPIKKIKTVYVLLTIQNINTSPATLSTLMEDVTNQVYEYKDYQLLNDDAKKTFFWYKEGEKILHLFDYSYNEPETLDIGITHTRLYQVEYEPYLNARVQAGTNDCVVQINQNSSQVDSNKFGKYLDSYLRGMNKADLVIKKTYVGLDGFNTFKDYIGSRVQGNGKEYLITAVSYRNRNLLYDVFFQLNENHFRKSNSYTASQEIRANSIITTENIKERKIVISYSLTLGKKNPPISKYTPLLRFAEKQYILGALLGGSACCAEMFLFDNNKESFTGAVAKFFLNNQLCLNFTFEDNALAGKSKEMNTDMENAPELGRVGAQTPVLYTDCWGEVNTATIKFVELQNKGLEITEAIPNEDYYKVINAEVAATEMPKATPWLVAAKTIAEIPKLNIKKDMLEKLNISVMIGFNSEDFITCRGLAMGSSLWRRGKLTTKILFYEKNCDEFTSEKDSSFTFYKIVENASLSIRSIDFTLKSIEELTGDVKSAIIWASQTTNNVVEFNEKCIIMNNLDSINSDVLEQLKNNTLKLYFAEE